MLGRFDRRVSGTGDRGKRGGLLVGHPGAREAHPGDVCIHRARRRELAPRDRAGRSSIGSDRRTAFWARAVVRVARVCVDRDDRGRVADHALFAEPAGHHLLDIVFGRGRASADALGDEVERAILDPVEPFGRLAVRRDRLARPSTPRSAARDRPTTPLPLRDRGCSRSCPRPRAPGRGSRPSASTPSRGAGYRGAACRARQRGLRDLRTRAFRRAACRDCATRWRARASGVRRWRESCRTTGAWSSCRCRPGRPGSSQRDSSRGSHRAAIRRAGRRRAPTARRRCRSASCKYSGAGKGCRPVPLRRRGPNVLC